MELLKQNAEIDLNNPMIKILIDLIEDFRGQIHKFILCTELEEDQFYLAMNYMFAGYMNSSGISQILVSSNNINSDEAMLTNFQKGMSILEKSKISFHIEQACALGIATVLIEVLIGELDSSKYQEEYSRHFSLNLDTICKANWLASGAINDLKAKSLQEFDNTMNIHLKGAKARSEKYKNKKIEAYRLFQDGNYYSYAECARAIYETLGIKDPNTVARWLSEMNKKT